MKNRKLSKAFILIIALALVALSAVGCSLPPQVQQGISAQVDLPQTQEAQSGTLLLKVNPELSVAYDENGLVTDISGRNDDGTLIAQDYTDYIGKDCKTVIKELVGKINEAGYFVDDVDGSFRNITIEVEPGSYVPSDTFLNDITIEIEEYVKGMTVNGGAYHDGLYGGGTGTGSNTGGQGATGSPNHTNYTDYDGYNTDYDSYTDYDGHTDYDGYDTDYNDHTDYNNATPRASAPVSTPTPAPTTNPSTPPAYTDHTDYNDPNTDYDDHHTDYGDSGYDD